MPQDRDTGLTSNKSDPTSWRLQQLNDPCRKKYLKLKYRFDKVMLESNNLYGEEQTLKKQARELQESNE